LGPLKIFDESSGTESYETFAWKIPELNDKQPLNETFYSNYVDDLREKVKKD
jgi:hypothetical protein